MVLRALLSLSAAVAVSVIGDRPDWLGGLLLGVIAAALADVEDSPRGRIRATVVTLLSFALVSFAVRLSFPYPWLFAPGLAGTAFLLTMLGAVNERYERVVIASLILSIYTVLRVTQAEQMGPFWWHPMQLLLGALTYAVVSVVWVLGFALNPARQALALIYVGLGRCLSHKAELLRPINGRERTPIDRALMEENQRVVDAMNQARRLLLTWKSRGQGDARRARLVQLYFLAQDLHERITSTHRGYDELSGALARSDFLFRAAHLADLQARACLAVAEAMSRQASLAFGSEGALALKDLRIAALHVQKYLGSSQQELGDTVEGLVENLAAVNAELEAALSTDSLDVTVDTDLRDDSPRSFREAWQRMTLQFTPRSARFRHGVRLALTLLVGYLVIQTVPFTRGYWMIMTAVFVLQRTYSATWKRLGQRVAGTVLGLGAVWVVLQLELSRGTELALMILAGTSFLAYRAVRYARATAAITVFVFLSLNQIGQGGELMLPRLIDTLAGGILAALAIAFVLPDWQGKRLHFVMSRTLAATAVYLKAVASQYTTGKQDHLAYRIARREAHNADGELAQTLAAMLGEPEQHQLSPEASFRFLSTSHRLLAFVSALGAHRQHLQSPDERDAVHRAAERIVASLTSLSARVAARGASEVEEEPSRPSSYPRPREETAPGARGALGQFHQIKHLLPDLELLALGVFEERRNGFPEGQSIPK